MLEKDETQTEVEKLVLGDDSEPSTEEKPEEAASDEVKVEEPKVEETPEQAPVEEPVKVEEAPEPAKPAEPVNVEKLQSQIENLNIALKKEREEGKTETEAMKAELEESKGMMERLKGAFAPEVEPEPVQAQPDQQYMTPEQVEQMLEQRESERLQKQEEEKRAQAITSEISNLETKWDGKEGRPKYDDSEVLRWQKNNDKLYLSPGEAFNAMNSASIIDYEVKQRLSTKKVTEKVEQPGSSPAEHEPGEVTPKTEAETRNAVIEAMNNADAEI